MGLSRYSTHYGLITTIGGGYGLSDQETGGRAIMGKIPGNFQHIQFSPIILVLYFLSCVHINGNLVTF